MSTTTISLPRPFIFTNAWPASALIAMFFPRKLIWRKRGVTPAAARIPAPALGRHRTLRRAMNGRAPDGGRWRGGESPMSIRIAAIALVFGMAVLGLVLSPGAAFAQ